MPHRAHMLCGLRVDVPDYVRDVLDRRTPPAWVTDHLGGIVVVPDADASTTAAAQAGDGGAELLLPDATEALQPPPNRCPGHAA